jgi:hypothetical protein
MQADPMNPCGKSTNKLPDQGTSTEEEDERAIILILTCRRFKVAQSKLQGGFNSG